MLCLCILQRPVVFDFITCQFLYRNDHSITKKGRVISCYSLILTWECKQTWLLLNFVVTIDSTSSQFPAYEKQQWHQVLWCWKKISLPPHCVKSVRIRSFSSPYFLAFGWNTERYSRLWSPTRVREPARARARHKHSTSLYIFPPKFCKTLVIKW